MAKLPWKQIFAELDQLNPQRKATSLYVSKALMRDFKRACNGRKPPQVLERLMVYGVREGISEFLPMDGEFEDRIGTPIKLSRPILKEFQAACKAAGLRVAPSGVAERLMYEFVKARGRANGNHKTI